jgi:hypothetical protein
MPAGTHAASQRSPVIAALELYEQMMRLFVILFVLSINAHAEVELFTPEIDYSCEKMLSEYGYDEKIEVGDRVTYFKYFSNSYKSIHGLSYKCKGDELVHFFSILNFNQFEKALVSYENAYVSIQSLYGSEDQELSARYEMVNGDSDVTIAGYNKHWGSSFRGLSLVMNKFDDHFSITYSIDEKF